VAKPALSSQIMDLEEEIGVRLLDRGATGATLTAAGEVFLAEAVKILQLSRDAIHAAQRAAEDRCTQLVVGYVSALSSGLIAPALEAFRHTHPEIDVTLAECPMEAHPARLRAGELHVGFEIGPMPPLPPGVERTFLRHVQIMAAVGAHHSLARQSDITMAQFVRERVLTISNPDRTSHRHGEQTRALAALCGEMIGSLSSCDGFESLLGMLIAGAGVALLPDISDTPRTRGVVFLPIRNAPPQFRVGLSALSLDHPGGKIARSFVQGLLVSTEEAALTGT